MMVYKILHKIQYAKAKRERREGQEEGSYVKCSKSTFLGTNTKIFRCIFLNIQKTKQTYFPGVAHLSLILKLRQFFFTLDSSKKGYHRQHSEIKHGTFEGCRLKYPQGQPKS